MSVSFEYPKINQHNDDNSRYDCDRENGFQILNLKDTYNQAHEHTPQTRTEYQNCDDFAHVSLRDSWAS
jgi:hypothetical protein